MRLNDWKQINLGNVAKTDNINVFFQLINFHFSILFHSMLYVVFDKYFRPNIQNFCFVFFVLEKVLKQTQSNCNYTMFMFKAIIRVPCRIRMWNLVIIVKLCCQMRTYTIKKAMALIQSLVVPHKKIMSQSEMYSSKQI